MKCAPPPKPLFTTANVTNSISTHWVGERQDPDGISPNLLKAARLELWWPVLTALFNIFLAAGLILSQWLNAHVVHPNRQSRPPGRLERLSTDLAHVRHLQDVRERVVAKFIISDTNHIWPDNTAAARFSSRPAAVHTMRSCRSCSTSAKRSTTPASQFWPFSLMISPRRSTSSHMTVFLPNSRLCCPRWIANYLKGRKQRVKIDNIDTE